MKIVDGQHHELGPRLDWEGQSADVQRMVLTELLLGWMDAVGVDAALINPLDNAWAADATAKHPDRLACVVSVKPDDPDVEQRIAQLREASTAVAVRVQCHAARQDPTGQRSRERVEGGVFDRLFQSCKEHDMPVFCSAYGYVGIIGEIAKRHPEVRFVVDHMAIQQPPTWPADDDPWRSLPELESVASLPNTLVKITGVPSLSREPYPYRDIWEPLHRVIDAFQPARTMWASDIGRFVGRIGWSNTLFPQGQKDYQGKHSYAEGLLYLRETNELSVADKEQILGGTVTKLVGWPTPA
jgi:predicted TIM-barrel fold metal-dependent hydrolase